MHIIYKDILLDDGLKQHDASHVYQLVPLLLFSWSCVVPYRLGLIKNLEKVNMQATKLAISIKNLTTYKDRLKRFKLPNTDISEVI